MLKHTQKIKELYEDIQRKLYSLIPEKWDSLYLYASVIEEKVKDFQINNNFEKVKQESDGSNKNVEREAKTQFKTRNKYKNQDKSGQINETGELFFYYVPKGIFKKKPINVYEIPSKFNINEAEYLKSVEILYDKIKELRREFKRLELGETWSNVTMIIKNSRFMVEYHYEDLKNHPLNSYERHVIWRCQYLGITFEQLNKEEKEILRKYATGPKILARIERYDAGIYIKDIENTVTYDTQEDET